MEIIIASAQNTGREGRRRTPANIPHIDPTSPILPRSKPRSSGAQAAPRRVRRGARLVRRKAIWLRAFYFAQQSSLPPPARPQYSIFGRASSAAGAMRDPFSRNVLVAGKSKSKTPKHPPSLNRRVNMSKVKLDVVKPWVARRVTELLGIEDDVLVSMIFNVMEMDQIHKDGSVMYGQLLTFLERNTATFMTVRAHSRDAAAERAVDPKRRR